jgi:hypothetical protein
MLVEVSVHFPIEEEHSQNHNERRHPVLARGVLPKNDDGEDGADEWSRCEPGAGPCRPYFPQGMNEKDEIACIRVPRYGPETWNVVTGLLIRKGKAR